MVILEAGDVFEIVLVPGAIFDIAETCQGFCPTQGARTIDAEVLVERACARVAAEGR